MRIIDFTAAAIRLHMLTDMVNRVFIFLNCLDQTFSCPTETIANRHVQSIVLLIYRYFERVFIKGAIPVVN